MLCLVFLCTSCSKRIDNPRKPAEEIIRIKLMNISKSKCPIQANGSWKLCCSTKAYYNIPQESSVTFEVYNKKILIKCNQKTIYQGLKFRCEPNGNTMFYIQVQEQQNRQQVWVKRLYAGKLFISLEYSEKDKEHILCIVNHVRIETYLQGVVPCKMNQNWEESALKAQAVVSRTYALYEKYSAKNKKNSAKNKKDFDVVNTDSNQDYKGFLDPQYFAKINKVINDTRGQVLFYNNFLFRTYFTACCGGHTECAKKVFNEKNIAPYVGVYCFCSQKNVRKSGYGVGLCQYGAQLMATKGFYYDAILLHYYPGSFLCKLW